MYTKEELLEKSQDELIEAFLKLTDFDSNLKTVINTQFDLVKNSIGCSDGFMESFLKVLDVNSYKESIYNLHKKYFTKNEIVDIILFYQTETGQSFIKKNMLIGIEIVNVAMDWANKECLRFENMYYKNNDKTLN